MSGTAFPAKDDPRRLQKWVTIDAQNPILGIMPSDTYVITVHCHVTELFNSDGTDQITVGWDTDDDALCTAIDVSSTGVKSVTMGANHGFNSTARKVKAYYVNGGSEPTTGKAFIWVESIKCPAQP